MSDAAAIMDSHPYGESYIDQQQVCLLRDNVVVVTGKIESCNRLKNDATKTKV
jgi:hypothetical protein